MKQVAFQSLPKRLQAVVLSETGGKPPDNLRAVPDLGALSPGVSIVIGLFFTSVALLAFWTDFEKNPNSLPVWTIVLKNVMFLAFGAAFLAYAAWQNFRQPTSFVFLRKGQSVTLTDRGKGAYALFDVAKTPDLVKILPATVDDVWPAQQPNPSERAALPDAVQKLLDSDQDVYASWTCQPRAAAGAVAWMGVWSGVMVFVITGGLTAMSYNPPPTIDYFAIVPVGGFFLLVGISGCIQPWTHYQRARDSLHILTRTHVLTFERHKGDWRETVQKSVMAWDTGFGWQTMDWRPISLDNVLGSVRIVSPDGVGTLLLHTSWCADNETKTLWPKLQAFYGVADVETLASRIAPLIDAARRRAPGI